MNYKNQKAGFSLIEVIIAFSILTITVVAATSLIANSIRANQDNILRVQAYFLAQEGLELARNQRDTNWLTSTLYTEEVAKNIETLITQKSDEPTGEYSFQTASGNTEKLITFERTVTLSLLDNEPTLNRDIEYKDGATSLEFDNTAQVVTSEVSFGYPASDSKRKKVTLTTILTDWKQSPL